MLCYIDEGQSIRYTYKCFEYCVDLPQTYAQEWSLYIEKYRVVRTQESMFTLNIRGKFNGKIL